jgi:3-phenylpropionate/trans-cinnamate dioxygenase ferredoxin subunit
MGKDPFVSCIKERDLNEGQMKDLRVRGKSILLVRKEGLVYALSNICPHMGCSMHRGILRDYLVMCPCHGWKFDIRTGEYTENGAISLESYPTKIENGQIYVDLKEEE